MILRGDNNPDTGGTLGLAACTSDDKKEEVSAVQVDLRILETSDLHTNIMDYDYYKTKYDPT